MTEALHLENPALRQMEATVVAVDGQGITLDRTAFYARGGGQPGDTGVLVPVDGAEIPIVDTLYTKDRSAVLHIAAEGAILPPPGAWVVGRIDWRTRLSRMKIHTALHLLSVVLPYPVTGGAIGDGEGRLDFDLPEGGLDRDEIAAKLKTLIDGDHAVSMRWITDAELEANPGLVKTMKVKPPMGSGRVRLVAIGDVDLQPCGGTHVARTSEIGVVSVTGIEKKGRLNRRVRIALADRPAALERSTP